MKKILFLAIALVMSVSAWAEFKLGDAKTVNQLSANMKIALKCVSNTNENWLCFDATKVTNKADFDASCVFTLEAGATEGSYRLKNASNDKYVGSNTGAFAEQADAVNFTLTGVTSSDGSNMVPLNEVTRFVYGSNFLNCQAAGAQAQYKPGTGGWSYYKVYAVTEILPAETYNIESIRGVLFANATNVLSTDEPALSVEKTDATAQWLKIPVRDEEDAYYLYNVGIQKFAGNKSGVKIEMSNTPVKKFYIWAHNQSGNKTDGSNTYNQADYPWTIGELKGQSAGKYWTINLCHWDGNGTGLRLCDTSSFDGGNEFAISVAGEFPAADYDALYNLCNPSNVEVTFHFVDPTGGNFTKTLNVNINEEVAISNIPSIPYFTATGFEESELVATESNKEFHVTGTWNMPFKFSTIAGGQFADNTTWYTIQNNGNATNNTGNGHVYYTANTNAENQIGATRELKAVNLWCFVAIPNTPGYFSLYNMATGADKPLRERTNASYVGQHHNQSVLTFNQADGEVKLAVRPNNDGIQFYLPDFDESNYRSVVGKHVGNNLSVWGKNSEAPLTDNGSRFFVKEVDDLVEALVAQQEAFEATMIVGSPLSLASNLDEAITAYKAAQTSATLKALAEANANPSETPLRELDANKYYRVIDLVNRYVYAVPTANEDGTPTGALDLKIYAAGTVANDVPSIFRIHKDGDNCTIEHVNSGYYIGVPPHGQPTNLAAEGAEFAIEKNGSTKFLFKKGTEYLNTNSSLYRVDGWNSNGDGSQWMLEEVSTFDVEFKQAGEGYATLYAPVAVSVPDGVEAYVTTREDNFLTAESVEAVPAKVGVVLKMAEAPVADTKVSFSLLTTAAPEVISDLTGNCIDRTAVEGQYVFSIVETHAGFYKFGGETLKANKAYYVPADGQQVQGFVIDFGGMTTGINAAQQAQSQKASFDLQGRRVSKATRGLFIQNGQKVIR